MEQDAQKSIPHNTSGSHEFSGHIYIFHAFDVGDDINLGKIAESRVIPPIPLSLPKYFKGYHAPLGVELPHPHESARCAGCKIHNFGAISLTYKIPFTSTLEKMRKEFNGLYDQHQEQSVIDVKSIFKKIKPHIAKPKFFQTRSAYVLIQVDKKENITADMLKKELGSVIASTLRFEKSALSEYQRNDIIESGIGYFRGDLIIVDTEATFVYNTDYEEILDFFEFANIQQLELRYFDRLLDEKLNRIYEGEGRKLPIRAYLPFIGTPANDPVGALGKLKVDISVITERLEGSIKIAGEPYLSELYDLLVNRLDLKNWQHTIERKLNIIHDIQSTHQEKIDVIREDMLTVLIIVLIFIELMVAVLK